MSAHFAVVAASAMKPGAYLQRRREAAGLTLDDLAFAIETIPALPAISRAEWLRQIEEGVAALQVDVVLALERHPKLFFDRDALFDLCALDAGLPVDPPALCRVCACSEWTACVSDHLEPCAWVEPDLCSGCAAPAAPVALTKGAAA